MTDQAAAGGSLVDGDTLRESGPLIDCRLPLRIRAKGVADLGEDHELVVEAILRAQPQRADLGAKEPHEDSGAAAPGPTRTAIRVVTSPFR